MTAKPEPVANNITPGVGKVNGWFWHYPDVPACPPFDRFQGAKRTFAEQHPMDGESSHP